MDLKSGDWVYVVDKKTGEVVDEGFFIAEDEQCFIVKVLQIIRSGLHRRPLSFSKDVFILVKED